MVNLKHTWATYSLSFHFILWSNLGRDSGYSSQHSALHKKSFTALKRTDISSIDIRHQISEKVETTGFCIE